MKKTQNEGNRIRRALCLTLALTCLFALVTCTPSGSPEGQLSANPETPDETAPSSASANLVVLTWPNYLSPDVLRQFEEKTGIHVVCEKIDNSDQFAQHLASEPGIADVVIADGKTLIQLIDLKLVVPLDQTKLSHLDNLSPQFLETDFDPDNAYSIPYLWGTTLLAYRKDHLPDPPRSWNLLWDDRVKNRTGLIDEPHDLFHIALASLEHDPHDAGEKEFGEATELLLRQLNEQGGIVADLYSGLDALDAGELSVVVTYSGDAAIYAAENDQIDYFIPEEGAPLWIDSLALCSRSENSSGAHRFIDFMTEAKSAAQTSNDLRYASPNRAAEPLIDKDILENPAIYPTPEVMAKCQFIRPGKPGQIQWRNRGISKIYDQLRLKSKTEESGNLPVDATAQAEPAPEDS